MRAWWIRSDELTPGVRAAAGPLRLRRWNDPALLAVALLALASGFGQFGVVAALADVAKTFGHVTHGGSIADQAGLSGTELGLGLGIIRLSSLGALPLTGVADRIGRRRSLLATVSLGLALTVLSALSPGFWWFIAIFALGRPLLSATNALTQVFAAEETSSSDRAKAVALVAAGYGIGAGLAAIVHSLFYSALGFRGMFALAALPLLGLRPLSRHVPETDRFVAASAAHEPAVPVLGILRHATSRFVVVIALAFVISVITGPANTFVFLYAESFVHLSGGATALMVIGAGASGLAGLLVGRFLADRIGRRPAGALGMVGVAAFGVVAYSGGRVLLVTGYVLGVFAGSLLAPALGALVNELFPTSMRASVAGWVITAGVLGAVAGLVAFGSITDVGNRFALSGRLVFLPACAFALLFLLLPETKGREPEELSPSRGGAPASGEPVASRGMRRSRWS